MWELNSLLTVEFMQQKHYNQGIGAKLKYKHLRNPILISLEEDIKQQSISARSIETGHSHQTTPTSLHPFWSKLSVAQNGRKETREGKRERQL